MLGAGGSRAERCNNDTFCKAPAVSGLIGAASHLSAARQLQQAALKRSGFLSTLCKYAPGWKSSAKRLVVKTLLTLPSRFAVFVCPKASPKEPEAEFGTWMVSSSQQQVGRVCPWVRGTSRPAVTNVPLHLIPKINLLEGESTRGSQTLRPGKALGCVGRGKRSLGFVPCALSIFLQ